jgi:hypothetical protein
VPACNAELDRGRGSWKVSLSIKHGTPTAPPTGPSLQTAPRLDHAAHAQRVARGLAEQGIADRDPHPRTPCPCREGPGRQRPASAGSGARASGERLRLELSPFRRLSALRPGPSHPHSDDERQDEYRENRKLGVADRLQPPQLAETRGGDAGTSVRRPRCGAELLVARYQGATSSNVAAERWGVSKPRADDRKSPT